MDGDADERAATSELPPRPRSSPPPPLPESDPRIPVLRAPPPPRISIVPAGSGEREAFETQLGREILTAERYRATLLATIPTVALFALVVAAGAYPEIVMAVFHGRLDLAPVGLFLIAVAGYELYVLATTRRALRRGEPPSRVRRYVQALVETSLPTAAILYYATIDGPVQALLMPSAFVYFVFILLSTLRLDFALCAFTGLVAAAEYGAIAILWGQKDTVFAEPELVSLPHHLGKAAILLVSGVAAGFVAQRLRQGFTRAIESVGERQRILGVFGQHVSPEVVSRLVAEKAEPRTELRDVCVMFLDIRDFTAFAESKPPDEVVAYLNVLFDSTIDAVVARHGIVNKFLGDGFMAIFGAPIAEGNPRAEAVDAALDIVGRVKALVDDGKIPPTRVGIGLHAGDAVVGNIGSTARREYTVIGDVVNVASRIEALNKELGSSVLASDDVWCACTRADVEARPRDDVAIRGRTKPIRVWQLA
ncbi:MAG TPA: adenylate/guanylate cyclase domain-containing protein [Labilithrix sp.]